MDGRALGVSFLSSRLRCSLMSEVMTLMEIANPRRLEERCCVRKTWIPVAVAVDTAAVALCCAYCTYT